MREVEINVARDFSEEPGARYYTDGPKSGQEFFETLLLPKFEDVKDDAQSVLVVNLDGTWGYASSFISGAFGELARKFGAALVLKKIRLISDDDTSLTETVINEIKSPDYQNK